MLNKNRVLLNFKKEKEKELALHVLMFLDSKIAVPIILLAIVLFLNFVNSGIIEVSTLFVC